MDDEIRDDGPRTRSTRAPRRSAAPTAPARTASSPTSTRSTSMPIPVEALDGFPDGVPRARGHSTAASSCAAACSAWPRSTPPAASTGRGPSRPRVAEAAEPMQPARDASSSTAATTGSTRSCPVGEYAPTRPSAPAARPRPGPLGGRAGRLDGRCRAPAAASRWANVGVSGRRQQRRHQGASTRSAATAPAAPGSDLAMFPAADYTPANRSHFDSRDYWFAGALQKMKTGWLGRWLDLYGSPDNPLQAVSLDSSISKQIRSAKAPVSAVRSLNGASSASTACPRAWSTRPSRSRRCRRCRPAPATTSWPRSREVYGRTVQVSRRCGSLAGAGVGRRLPATRTSRTRLQLAADAAGGEPGHAGHHDRLGLVRHPRRPAPEPGPAALRRSRGRWPPSRTTSPPAASRDRVLTMVFSEFGRRVESNESGTDHGAGGLMMAMGSVGARRHARRVPRA